MHSHGPDLTVSVQNGLAWFYALVALANLGFALYQHLVLSRRNQLVLWVLVAGIFAVHSAAYFAHLGWVMPLWLREMSDHGVHRGLLFLGVDPDSAAVVSQGLGLLLVVVLLLGLADAASHYLLPGSGAWLSRALARLWRGLPAHERLVGWGLLVSVLALVLRGTDAISYFLISVAGFFAFLVWRRVLTLPPVAWGLLDAGLLFGGWSMTDRDFREIIIKPDNVPIVGLVFVVGFFTWLALRKGVVNDERMARGLPPAEKEEDEKVLVWPDLVYTELICMVIVTVVLIVWAVALPAPLEQPASSTKTPNPSKAPWYFLGLQEMLVYYDPWIAGVVLPTIIILGLIAIPYIDFNQKGNGYYTFEQRAFAIVMFLFGFVVLWVTLIFLGTFLRGQNWNFFGLYETRNPYKLVPLNNVNLSEYFWLKGLGIVWDRPGEEPSIVRILARESPGIVGIVLYFMLLPPVLARTVLRSFYLRMGFIRYMILSSLILLMAALPIKMILRWAFNLKYIVAIPEYFFNI